VPQIRALNKIDLMQGEEIMAGKQSVIQRLKYHAETGEGLEKLKNNSF
jgi:50S ribosomal subunit-associated GTPase HflX